MNKIPFGVYDFFAYLSSGAVLLATADYIWNLGLLTQKDTGPILGVALIIITYVSGQIVAHFSSFLFEQILVGRVLQRPSALLFGSKPCWVVFRWIFPNYHRSLPTVTKGRVYSNASARHCIADGEALFLHAYAVVTNDERIQARLDEFRNQYGFARNMSFALIFSAGVQYTARLCWGYPTELRWALLAFIAGITLFFRYLKFFRQYSFELFLRYAELPLSQ